VGVIYHKLLLRLLIMLEHLLDFSNLYIVLRSTIVRIVNAYTGIRLHPSSSTLKSNFLPILIF
jgi:hypothetical protein